MEYRFDQCTMIGNQLIDEILNFEGSQHTLTLNSQTKVVELWNTLPFNRKEVVTLDIYFNCGYKTKYQEPFGYELKNSFKIFDNQGKEVPYGLVSMKKNYKTRKYNQFVESNDIHTVSFEAQLPAMGSVEYKIVPYNMASRYLNMMSKSETEVENEYLKLKINNDGTIELYDKLNNNSYHQLLSYGDDGEIGDGWYHASPVEDSVVSSLGSNCIIERIENGPSRTVFKVTNLMKVPDCLEVYPNGIRRSQNYVTLKICSLIGLSKGAKHVDIKTSVSNIAKDHRLRLKLPTNINTSTFFADQPFAFVERKTGVNLETQTWRECEVPEKQMGGIVLKRFDDGTGLAFVSPYGLHECAAQDDEAGTMLVTLFRSFSKTVMTNGEEGGQIIGDLEFKYSILPMQAETNYADLIRLKECTQTMVKSTTFTVAEDYILPQFKSYFQLISDNICMSILKPAENSEKSRVILRLYNMSKVTSEAEIKCFKEISGVEEVNLNEEYIRSLPSGKNNVIVELAPWKVMTLALTF